MMPPRALRICLTLLAIQGSVCVRAAEYSHRIFRTEDGLPQNRAQAIAQTNDGYLWIGTSEGLARFDGARFVILDRSNTPAITDNSIVSLEPSPDGSLWIGTEGGGLLHLFRGVFEHFGQNEGLTNGFIRAAHLDAAGTLWIGTDRGLFRYANRSFLRLDNTPEVPLASVSSLTEDASGTIWASSAAGLLQIAGGRLRHAPCPAQTGISGQLTISLIRERLIPSGCNTVPDAIRSIPVNSIHKDLSGNLWIGTIGQGLISVDGNSGERTSYLGTSILPDNTVVWVFEDSQHNIWAAAQDGLVRFSRAVVTTMGAPEGLVEENVSTTYEDRLGTLWLVTFSGQVYRLNGPKAERYYLPAPFRDLRFRSVFMDSRGDYWFGTQGSGVVQLSHGKATAYTQSEGLRSNSVRHIFEDSRGVVWFATSSGLSAWNQHSFRNYYLEDGLSYPSTRCVGETREGDILVGTDAGLNKIHNGKIVNDPAFAPLKQEKIWSLYVDDKSIWLGTRGGGLVLLRDGKITRFSTRQGMTSNSIYQIVDDRAGRLWMSSPVGISSVRRVELDSLAAGKAASLRAIAYGSSDGMATGQMSGGIQPAGCRRASGDVWFPSVRGAVKLDPRNLPLHRSGPAVIERISAGDQTLATSGEVIIAPGRDKIHIDFTACNLVAPQQVSFRYKLEGVDDSWTVATRLRTASWSSLPPGHYKFRVIAEDSGFAGSSSEAALLIFRQPAFHQTIWFYLLLSALLICGLWGGILLYARQTRARFAVVLNERTRVAREMHDTVIQGCVGVSTLLDAAARFQRSDLAEATQLLAHARVQIKETLEEARLAVWDLRNSDSKRPPVTDLLGLARKLGVEYGVQVEERIEGKPVALDPVRDRALLLVGREALRNAVLHGNPTLISIGIAYQAGRVVMEVRDDGRGFDSNAATLEPDGHFGIVGMRERVEQLGGVFSLESRPGHGTLVSVSLPVMESAAAQNSTIPR